MLEPQTRATLTEQLAPPPGWELAHAVGTTFTLDLATALAVPLSFASRRLSAEDDKLGILDAVRRAADRVDVFAQAGEIGMGIRSDLVALLEPMIHPVTVRRGLFHPKVWFLEYQSGDERRYRFLCASRNLTEDRSWDVIVRLDGQSAHPEAMHDAQAMNKPLVRLLRALPSHSVQPVPPARIDRIEALASRWESIDWEKPTSVRSLAFHVFGVGPSPTPDLAGQRALLISPFLSDDGVADLRRRIRTETHLVSRADSLDRLAPSSFGSRLRTYVLDDAAADIESDESEASSALASPNRRLSGLHAKVVIVDRKSGSHILLGSANATRAAWHDNVEVMVEVSGRQALFGVQATLDALGELVEPFSTEGGQAATEKEDSQHRLEALLRGLAEIRLAVRVLPGDPYSVRVWAEDDIAAAMRRVAKAGAEVSWHLLTRADLGEAGLHHGENGAPVLLGVSLTDITPFIVAVIRDAAGNVCRSVLLARMLDDIPDRHDAVIARQLTDRAAFVRLLTLLLELSGVSIESNGGAFTTFGASAGGSDGSGLFEALVRAVGEKRNGLADARRIIDFIRSHGDDQAVIPEGFEELWDRVWRAHHELKGATQ